MADPDIDPARDLRKHSALSLWITHTSAGSGAASRRGIQSWPSTKAGPIPISGSPCARRAIAISASSSGHASSR